MSPKQLLAYFDRIAEAPGAVPRLRRFIVDLAVRGKLVEQNASDEPAAQLLIQVQAEQRRSLAQRDCGKSVYVPAGIPFIRSQNVHNSGLVLDDVANISLATHKGMSGTHVQPNDILLNITGASIGRCAIVNEDFSEGNVSQHVAIIRLLLPAIRHFLHLVLISPPYQRLIDDVQVGVSRAGLTWSDYGCFPSP